MTTARKEIVADDVDDGFGPYLCLETGKVCNAARDHCRCWWVSKNPEHFMRLAEAKIASRR